MLVTVVSGQNSFPGGETLGYNLLIACLFPVHKIKMCILAVGCLVYRTVPVTNLRALTAGEYTIAKYMGF